MTQGISRLGGIHIGAAIALFILATTTVALRFYCRLKQRQRLFADDWLSLVAVVLALALVVEACVWSTAGGFGWPLMSLQRAQVLTFFHILFAQRITYWLISLTTKLSILLLYLRLFQVQPTFRALIHLIALLTIAASALGIISFTYRYIVAFTTHASLSVILADPALLRFVLSGAALGFALDCIILCMPLPLVWSMNLNRAKKWSVSGVFLLGGLTCVSSALRIVFIYGVHAHSYQYALEGPSCIWSTVEALLSIVSACLPTLRPLFVWFLQKRQGVGGSGEGGDVGGAEDGAGEVEEGRGRVVELMASKSLQGRQQQGQHRYLSVTSTMLSLTRTSTSMPRPPSPVLTGHASAQATGDSKRPVVDVEAVEADLADTCTGTSTGNVSHGHRKAPE